MVNINGKEKTKMLDLAKWNVVNDYNKVKADGINAVVLKAVNMNGNVDGRFETHMAGCKKANIDVFATYHYTYATSIASAINSAQKWIKVVNGRCKRFILDWEDSCLPKGNQLMVDIINAYAGVIKNAGCDFYVYTGQYYYNTYMAKYKSQLPYKFWIAKYYNGYNKFVVKDEPNLKAIPNCDCNMVGWQYSSSCQVNGIQGNVDISLWFEFDKTVEVPKPVVKPTMPIDKCPFKEPTVLVTSDAIAKAKGYKSTQYVSKGEYVKWVQWHLWRFGKLVDANGIPNEKEIDGIWGAKTEKALKEVQLMLNLTPDGIVGKATIQTFKKLVG